MEKKKNGLALGLPHDISKKTNHQASKEVVGPFAKFLRSCTEASWPSVISGRQTSTREINTECRAELPSIGCSRSWQLSAWFPVGQCGKEALWVPGWFLSALTRTKCPTLALAWEGAGQQRRYSEETIPRLEARAHVTENKYNKIQ